MLVVPRLSRGLPGCPSRCASRSPGRAAWPAFSNPCAEARLAADPQLWVGLGPSVPFTLPLFVFLFALRARFMTSRSCTLLVHANGACTMLVQKNDIKIKKHSFLRHLHMFLRQKLL